MKLLRTIRLDPSDSFVFEKPAEPGEWAVSGAFEFTLRDPAGLAGKARTAFRAGFLGLGSLGRSTLVQIVEASEDDRRTVVEMLAGQLVRCFGAPDLAIARRAVELHKGSLEAHNANPGLMVTIDLPLTTQVEERPLAVVSS